MRLKAQFIKETGLKEPSTNGSYVAYAESEVDRKVFAAKYIEWLESKITSTNKQSVSASQINHTLKNMESDSKRYDFINVLINGICVHCGKVTESCFCMRDD